MLTTNECAFKDVSIKLLGRTIVGLRGFSFKTAVEKEHLYGAGSKPIDIQEGNEKPEGNLKLLKFEVDQLNDAAQAAGYNSILNVPHTAITITCAFKKTPTSPMRICQAVGVAFTEMPFDMEQNAKQMEVTLPFLAMDVTVRNA